MRRVFAGRDWWIHQMMMRELADPTPALDIVVAEVIKPRMEYLSQIIAALLDAQTTDGGCVCARSAFRPSVWRCSAADSPIVSP
jgi:hypothetical protein